MLPIISDKNKAENLAFVTLDLAWKIYYFRKNKISSMLKKSQLFQEKLEGIFYSTCDTCHTFSYIQEKYCGDIKFLISIFYLKYSFCSFLNAKIQFFRKRSVNVNKTSQKRIIAGRCNFLFRLELTRRSNFPFSRSFVNHILCKELIFF